MTKYIYTLTAKILYLKTNYFGRDQMFFMHYKLEKRGGMIQFPIRNWVKSIYFLQLDINIQARNQKQS